MALRAASLVDAEHCFPHSLQILARTRDPLAHARERWLLEFTSRGDRVPASLWLPVGQSPAALVCLQYGAGGSVDAGHESAVDELTAVGFAVATLDWALHGRRASVKLSKRLSDALSGDEPDPNGAPLVEQFILQSVVDLDHLIRALSGVAPIRTDQIALAGVGIAAHLAALFASINPHPTALCLAPTRLPSIDGELPLTSVLQAGRKRPVLLLARKHGSDLAPEELEAMRLACPGSAELEMITGRIDSLDREGARHIARFLARILR